MYVEGIAVIISLFFFLTGMAWQGEFPFPELLLSIS